MNEIRLFDSHLHFSDRSFAEDREAVLERARAAGVVELVTVASDPEDAGRAIDLARRAPRMWATAGLHPHEAASLDGATMGRLQELAREPEVVAIGETGLDYHYDNSPRAKQLESFRLQLQFAAESGLPVIVHSREADEDTASLISEYSGRVNGVLHCFTGGGELLNAGLEAGWFVSFSGIVTFKRYDGEDHVRRVPDDRLLIETDSPYLSPVPVRGRRNEPAHLVHTCRRVAEIRRTDPQDIAEITRRNAFWFFNLERQ